MHQGLVEIKNVLEIFPGILVGLAHQALGNKIENNLAEVGRTRDAPHTEDDARHETEFAHGQIADAFEEPRIET